MIRTRTVMLVTCLALVCATLRGSAASGAPADTPATVTLTISVAGTGHGSVTSAPGGIHCGSSCVAEYAPGQHVLLHAVPDSSSEFAGWSGACSGPGGCLVRMEQQRQVTAVFVSLATRNVIDVDPPGSGGCTLAAAIQAANADAPAGGCRAGSGADIIRVPAGIYTFTTPATTGTALPMVTSDITLIGDGADVTVLERAPGSAEFRLLDIFHTGARLTLRGFTLRGGNSGSGSGGAIRATGPLTVRECVFTDNRSRTANGGAIRMHDRALVVADSTFAGNYGPGRGGAIYADGSPAAPMHIMNSLFDGNDAEIQGGALYFRNTEPGAVTASAGLVGSSAIRGNTAGAGGGVFATGLTFARLTVTGNGAAGSEGGGLRLDTAVIVDSTIADNSATGVGGGLSGYGPLLRVEGTTLSGNTAASAAGAYLGSASAEMTNVTVSGNRASTAGGGLFQQAGHLTLQNVTVAGNSAGGTGWQDAGGVWFGSSNTVRHSIIASNTAALSPDCGSSAGVTSAGHNLIGDAVNCTFQPALGDLVGSAAGPIDPLLAPLGDNGGPTWTHAPLPGSPAIDAGGDLSDGGCASIDQRGVARPQGTRCDVGAVEVVPPPTADDPPADDPPADDPPVDEPPVEEPPVEEPPAEEPPVEEPPVEEPPVEEPPVEEPPVEEPPVEEPPVNRAPDCSAPAPSVTIIWPPNRQMVPIAIAGVTDPEGDAVQIAITAIFQDEPVNTAGDGNTPADGAGIGTPTALVRAERSGSSKVPGNGRVYEIHFTATDAAGASCSGSVQVGVPHDRAKPIVDDGARYRSTR